jgi:hypothetical protein
MKTSTQVPIISDKYFFILLFLSFIFFSRYPQDRSGILTYPLYSLKSAISTVFPLPAVFALHLHYIAAGAHIPGAQADFSSPGCPLMISAHIPGRRQISRPAK